MENATTRVAQRPFLARNDRVQLLHINSGAAPCGPSIAATAWRRSACELGTAWGAEKRVASATTRAMQHPFWTRNDRKAARLLRIRVRGRPCSRGIAATAWPTPFIPAELDQLTDALTTPIQKCRSRCVGHF